MILPTNGIRKLGHEMTFGGNFVGQSDKNRQAIGRGSDLKKTLKFLIKVTQLRNGTFEKVLLLYFFLRVEIPYMFA